MPSSNLLRLAWPWLESQLRYCLLKQGGGDADPLAAEVLERGGRFFREARDHAALHQLQRLGLSETELAIVLMLAAAEHEAGAGELLTRIDATNAARALKLFVYGDTMSAAAFEELGPTSRLARLGLITPGNAGPPEAAQWSLSSRVVALLLGADVVDAGLEGVLVRPAPADPAGELAVDPRALAALRTALSNKRAVVVVAGTPGSGRRASLMKAAREAGIDTLAVEGSRLGADLVTLRRQLRSIALECRLRGLVPVFVDLDALVGDKNERVDMLTSEMATLVDGLVLATSVTQRVAAGWGRPTIVIEMGQPTSAQRASLWHASLGQGTEEDARLLAERYPLAPALIVRASEAAKARAGGRPLEPEDLYAGIRSVLDDRLGQFAKRVTATQSWDDLVLAPEQLDTIAELMARVRGRSKVYEQWGFAAKLGKGLGVSALFSGPPGTGKTMVAALIARDLGLELYQVDLGKVVSKFIGETEKNLGALFDAAEAGHAILLFDEADALFGKRTDVKSSNDRYANLETNYLLQRLESFTGICLLTTNYDRHLDPAFQRRLSLHLRFELPDLEERAQLWRATLPEAAPLAEDVDFGALARRFAMSGGYIRNAALRAAFLAADEDLEITAAHLERAARVEYEGLGKLAA